MILATCMLVAPASALVLPSLRSLQPAVRAHPCSPTMLERPNADADTMLERPETDVDTPSRQRGLLWGRLRGKVKVQPDAPLDESATVLKTEIDQVISARRKLLDTKLKVSLSRVRSEVMEEVETQADEAKQRQERLAERQRLIVESLSGLREDILDDIEARTEGLRRGGRQLECSLRDFRSEWESEVNTLIEEARSLLSTADPLPFHTFPHR